MTVRKMLAQLPALPPPEFFNKPEHTIMSDDGAALISYDTATCAGFVYHVATESWSISAPVDFTTFALLVRMSGYTVSDSEDTRRWFQTCSPNPAGANVVDFPPARTKH